ncbi:carbohydrate ABC transporter permease [Mycoplasmopsis pulmonis]|nr:sugar ABC transporter permease [Mycoplasmopsis pulmonis]MDZ7293492.1 sugar ABC transporter permease [Mycoplasmopsis pulmonis]
MFKKIDNIRQNFFNKENFSKKVIVQNLKATSFLIPILLLVIIFTFVPIIKTFKDAISVYERHSRVNFTFGIRNFESTFNDPYFKDAFFNSNILLVVATPLGIVVAFLFSLIINSIALKVTKNFLITTLYSQFFISSFAIGLSFIFLFGDQKSVFNKLFGTNIAFTREHVLLTFSIFHIWRLLPFNVVLFSFALSKANEKYSKKFKVDRLTIADKIKNVYWFYIKRAFMLIFYINFISAILLYPGAIIESTTDLKLNKATTFASYIFDLIRGTNFQPERASAASFIVFAYIMTLIFSFYILTKITRKTSRHISAKIEQRRLNQYV